MDDFLYIILGIAWVVWSLYSNKQKLDKKRAEQAYKEEQARQARQENREYQAYPDTQATSSYEPVKTVETYKPEKTDERSVLEEIFGEYLPHQEAEPETYVPEVSEMTWDSKMTAPGKIEAESLEEIKEEVPSDYFSRLYRDDYKSVLQEVKMAKAIEQEPDEIDEIIDEFDLKRAVIYSEILRTPYTSER